jgi:Holliday junction resolvase
MSINVKKKGNRGENAFAEWLRTKGVKAYRDSASGGGNGNKSDISTDTDFGFEVKTVKALNLKKSWAQCDLGAGMNKTVPVLAVHFDGMPKEEWLMVMHSEDWAHYVLGDAEVTNNYTDPQLKHALQNMVDSAKKLMKSIEKL